MKLSNNKIVKELLNSRLARKQLLFIVIFSSLITLIGTCVQLLVEYRNDIDYIDMQLLQIKNSHLESLNSSLWKLDDNQLKIELKNILNLRDIVYIEVSEDKKLLFSAGTPPASSKAIQKRYPMTYDNNGVKENIGTLYAYASLGNVYRRMFRRIFIILTIQGFKTFVVSFFILYVIYRLVVQHLIKVSNYAQRLRLYQLEHRLDLNRRSSPDMDELDLLVGSINDMRQQLIDDVEAQKSAEDTIRESEEKYRQLSEQSLVGIYLIHDGVFRYVNPKFAEIYGYTVNECLDKMPYHQLVHPDDKNKVMEQVRARASGEIESAHYTARGIKKNGEIIHTEIFGSSTRFEGEPAVIGTILDITERMSTGEALTESQRQLATLMSNLPGMAYRCNNDPDWTMEFVSDGCQTLTGYKPEALLDNSEIPYGEIIHPEDRQAVWDEVEAALKNKVAYRLTYRLITFSGELKWVWEQGRGVVDTKGNIVALEGFISDITEKKRMENELIQAQKMESIGTLAGGIAHDFNNILSIMIGNTELAMHDIPDGNPTRSNIEEIRKAGLRAKDMIRQLLSFSRITRHERKPIRITPLIEESIKFLRSSIPSNIEIRQNLTATTDIISANSTQILQAMINLCTNAAHSMEETGGIIEIGLTNKRISKYELAQYRRLKTGLHVLLSVGDTGCGIEPHIIERIFDPYFTTKKIDKGTGMGLAVVHGIVKIHEGAISIKSELGKGTTVHVLFPAVEAVAKEAPDETSESLPRGKERILFVDDEAAIVKVGKLMLERMGYRVTAHTESREALEIFKANPKAFDLVVTDMTMPNMTGIQLAGEIRKIRPAIPIILCTGFNHQVNDEKCKAIGIQGFVLKPTVMKEMAETVRSVLDHSQTT